MRKASTIMLIILILGIGLSSCDKKETLDTAPELPPLESMVFDFSQLNLYKSAELSKSNWIYSASTVSFWSTILVTTLAVPVAAFHSAVEHEPTRINDQAWQWQYNVNGFTSNYTARLVGKLESNHIKWEMYITKTGIESFDEFLWFEGTSEMDGKSGQWTLYHSAESQDKLLQIDWLREGENVGQIKYTYIRQNDSQNNDDNYYGSTLTYGLQDSELDIYIDVHIYNQQAMDFVDSNIEWSSTEYNGHVKAEHFFNDTNWHCWDSSGNDIDCGE
jgi:hypothetical protein